MNPRFRAVLVALALVGAVPSMANSQARSGRRAGAQASSASSPAPTTPSQPSMVFSTPPTIETLPNGLKVAFVPWPSPGIVSYNTVVRVGSRDEVEAGHSGFAHLFEHMMFRGTPRYSEEAYERAMQAFGADANAFTSSDFTFYTATIPSSALPKIIDLESDRFQHLQYSEQQFRTETGAVLGEYNKSAADPSMKLEEVMDEMAFTRHTYGHTTIGYLRDVQAMPGYYEYSNQFFHRFYTPDDCTIVVVGDFDRAAVLAQIRTAYAGWEGHRDNPQIPVEPEPRRGEQRHVEWDGTSPPKLMIGYRVPSFDEGKQGAAREAAIKETAALQVIHELVFSRSAPLYQSLVVDRQELLSLGSWSGWFSRDPGLFVAQATLKPDVSFESIRDAIGHEFSEIGAGHIPADRIRDVQNHLRYATLMGLETPGAVAELIGRFVSVTGDMNDVDAYLRALAALTPADVARVANRYLTDSRRFVVTLSSRETAAPAPTPVPAAAPASPESAPAPAEAAPSTPAADPAAPRMESPAEPAPGTEAPPAPAAPEVAPTETTPAPEAAAPVGGAQ